MRVAEEANAMARADYEAMLAQEEQGLSNAMLEIEKINAADSKDYNLYVPFTDFNEGWKYNSYTKGYSGSTLLYNVKTNKFGHVSGSDFKAVVYPALLSKIENAKNQALKKADEDKEQDKKRVRTDLEEYYKEKGIEYTWNPNGEYESGNLKSVEDMYENEVKNNIYEQVNKCKQLLEELVGLSN